MKGAPCRSLVVCSSVGWPDGLRDVKLFSAQIVNYNGFYRTCGGKEKKFVRL
jgi:hypothetical protein